MENYSSDRSYAIEQDALDPLAPFRNEFYIPQYQDKDAVYFLGNSLGAQPKTTAKYIKRELDRWKEHGALGHFVTDTPWKSYQDIVKVQLAKLVGALPSEVMAMNTLTVNLHLMMVSFYKPTPTRYKILVNPHLFPSDQYAIESQIKFHGFNPKDAILTIPTNPQGLFTTDDVEKILRAEGASIALILMEGVSYYTGQAIEISNITTLGHQYGCIVGIDLAHTVGNRELILHDSNVDFAVWCTYKYLNAGPGSVGCCFVHEKHHRDLDLPRFAGWFGQQLSTDFGESDSFKPIPSAEGWQISNAPILSIACLKASLDIFEKASLPALRKKSIHLTGYLEYLLKSLKDPNLSIITPSESNHRGCQLSISFGENTEKMLKRLKHSGFICDLRPPNVIRFTPVPLYNTFLEVYQLYEFLKCEQQS